MNANLRRNPIAINRAVAQRVFTTPSMEAHATALIDRARTHRVDVEVLGGTQASQESQQLEHHAQKNEISRLRDQVNSFQPQSQVTGHVATFLIDPHEVASGNIEAQSTLTAIAETRMLDGRDVAVAVLPLSRKLEAEYVVDESDIGTVVQTLESIGARVFVTEEAFVNFLRGE